MKKVALFWLQMLAMWKVCTIVVSCLWLQGCVRSVWKIWTWVETGCELRVFKIHFFTFKVFTSLSYLKNMIMFLLNLNAKGDFRNKKSVCQMHSLNSKYTWPYIRNLRQRRNLIDTYVKIWTWVVIGCKLGRCSKFIFHFQSILLRYLIWKTWLCFLLNLKVFINRKVSLLSNYNIKVLYTLPFFARN